MIRQGNQNAEVFIYRYITEGSFDSYNWQLLENKQKFIASFLSASLTHDHRREKDIADTVLNYAEIKALCIGNPLIKRRVEVSNRLEHVRLADVQRKKQLLNLESLIASLPQTIANTKKNIAVVDADKTFYQMHKQVIKNHARQKFGERLLEALSNNEQKMVDTVFDTYQGFDVILPRMMEKKEPFVYLRRLSGGEYIVDMKEAKARGCSTRLDHVLGDLTYRVERLENKLEKYKLQLEDAKVEVAKGNVYDKQIAKLQEELLVLDAKLEQDLKDEGGK